MERTSQLDEAVGHRLLTVQRHKVVVVKVVRDLEAQAVLGEGVAPEVYGPDGLPDLRACACYCFAEASESGIGMRLHA